MTILTLEKAKAYLDEAEGMNPGPWVPHSYNVAAAARLFAEQLDSLDPDRAYVYGLLHDIGRREGVTGMRHVYDGYIFLSNEGYPDAARYALTHSFPTQDVRTGASGWDCTPDELEETKRILQNFVYNDYDRLLQLCDSLALPEGFCRLEKRWIDVLMRYQNFDEFTVPKWQGFYEIKADFEKRMRKSIYALLPGLID